MDVARLERDDPAVAAVVVEQLWQPARVRHAGRQQERRSSRPVPPRRPRDDRAGGFCAEQVAERLLRRQRALADADEAARDRATPGELDDLAPRRRARTRQPPAAQPDPVGEIVGGGEVDVGAADLRLAEEGEGRRLAAEHGRQRPPRETVEAREAAARLLERHAAPHSRDLAFRPGRDEIPRAIVRSETVSAAARTVASSAAPAAAPRAASAARPRRLQTRRSASRRGVAGSGQRRHQRNIDAGVSETTPSIRPTQGRARSAATRPGSRQHDGWTRTRASARVAGRERHLGDVKRARSRPRGARGVTCAAGRQQRGWAGAGGGCGDARGSGCARPRVHRARAAGARRARPRRRRPPRAGASRPHSSACETAAGRA